MFSDFEDARIMHEGPRTVVRRARRGSDGTPVLLKSPRAEVLSPAQRMRLRHEFELLQHLQMTSVVRVLALVEGRFGPTLVLEDTGAESLQSAIGSGGMELKQFFIIAPMLARAVGELHRVQVIHRNITPANVIVHPTTGQPTLIDFANASRLPHEQAGLRVAHELEGTLGYISPEQTGRMNRVIDWRSDLYSLGATFYEMLTGQPPFVVADPMAMVHALVARMPDPPRQLRPEVPQPLSALVLKLLSKAAEERYQSAQSLAKDLELIRDQLFETGRVEPFELGAYDNAARFQIPQKLYGREEQVAMLFQSFERAADGAAEVVLLTGESGIGKSAIAHEIHKPIAARQGYFLHAKFDQFQRSVPYGPLVLGLRDFLHHVLAESEERVVTWKAKLSEAIGANAGLLTRAIRELEFLLGTPAEVVELSSEENQHRVNLAFLRLLQTFATAEHPLVIFLDDLQWADLASLSLIERLLCDEHTRYLLLLGAYRGDEVDATHLLTRMLETLRTERRPICQLSVGPLGLAHVRQLIAESLCQPESACQSLAELLYERTQGNPFLLREFVTSLHEDGRLKHAPAGGRWTWDMEEIRNLGVTENVAQLMTVRIRKLPAETQTVLQLAACVGNRFDLRTLAIVYECTEAQTEQALWPAIEAGLVSPVSASPSVIRIPPETAEGHAPWLGRVSVCRFAHDRVQQAAYESVLPGKRSAVHLQIGRLILTQVDQAELEVRLFEVVQHLNHGLHLVDAPGERERLARLNLTAGRRALRAAAYQSAVTWLRLGRGLLLPDAWKTQYELALSLHCEGAEAARLVVDFDEMSALASEVMTHARTVLDALPVYETLIVHHTLQVHPGEALAVSREFLARLGYPLPERPSAVRVGVELFSIWWLMRGKTVEELASLPEMTDPERLAAMRVLLRANSAAYIASPNTFPLIILQMVRLSLRHGNCAQSAFGYTTYGLLLSAVLGKHNEGHALGRFGLSLMERFQAWELKPKLYISFYMILQYWKAHLRDALAPLVDAFHFGIESGDIEYACHCAGTYAYYIFCVGEPLELVHQRQAEFLPATEKYKNEFDRFYIGAIHQLVLTLRGIGGDPLRMVGSAFDEDRDFPRLLATKGFTPLYIAWECKALLCYFHGDMRGVLRCAEQANAYVKSVLGSYRPLPLYETLALIACHSELTAQQRRTLRRNRRQLSAWARQSPHNYRHKHLLVEAELSRLSGSGTHALSLYQQAIELALGEGYLHEAAIAMELAARYHLSLGLQRSGWGYLHDAWRTYNSWGAVLKAAALEAELKASSRGPDAALLAVNSVSPAAPIAHAALDLTTLFSASRAISEELVLEPLLRKLVRLLLENAGAERGVLVVESGGKLMIEAEAHANGGDVSAFSPVPVDGSNRLSKAILNYVVRTGQSVVLHDATAEGLFISDEYVVAKRTRSVLCAPLANQGRTIAVIYLENNLAAGAFTKDRLRVLELLLSQAALSIHNARLYANLEQSRKRLEEYSHSLEERVGERTQELRNKNEELSYALTQLRETQAQLVQQEKLASLGALTAGIAHELKNPLNFVKNFAELSLSLSDELIASWAAEGLRFDSKERAELKENLVELHGNISKIHEHGNRANNIINSMLLHSQVNAAREWADLNSVVAESIELAHHGVHTSLGGLEVSIEAQYDDRIGLAEFSVQSIGRVLINILNNAFYAMAEKQRTAEPGYRPVLRVWTQELGHRCEIHIADNGTGIPLEHLDKIFVPFYTTKPRGQGTGLGLSMSHDIVVNGHKGDLRVESVPGRSAEFIISLPKGVRAAGVKAG